MDKKSVFNMQDCMYLNQIIKSEVVNCKKGGVGNFQLKGCLYKNGGGK